MGHVEEAEKLSFMSDALQKRTILSNLILAFLSSLHMFIKEKCLNVVKSRKRGLKMSHNSNTFSFFIFSTYSEE